MKRIMFFVALVASVMGLKAQNCEALVLPYFNGDASAMAEYPQEKFDWQCCYARAAFYVSDTVPAGAVVYSITEVVSKDDGKNLSAAFIVDLSTLSYYAYNFHDIQLRYRKCNVTIAFSTPASEHQYLVLRSIDETYALSEILFIQTR